MHYSMVLQTERGLWFPRAPELSMTVVRLGDEHLILEDKDAGADFSPRKRTAHGQSRPNLDDRRGAETRMLRRIFAKIRRLNLGDRARVHTRYVGQKRVADDGC